MKEDSGTSLVFYPQKTASMKAVKNNLQENLDFIKFNEKAKNIVVERERKD